MREGCLIAAALTLALAGPARAESGSFFKNLFGSGGDAPGPTLPRAQDPDDVYCPPVEVLDGAAALRSSAGSETDNTRLRHQIALGRISRECKARPDGSVGVRVGVQLRAVLGPAGAPGRFEAPLTVSIRANEKALATRTRRVAVVVPQGAVQGEASVIEEDLSVPAEHALVYEIAVALAGAPAGAGPRASAKRRKPAADAVPPAAPPQATDP